MKEIIVSSLCDQKIVRSFFWALKRLWTLNTPESTAAGMQEAVPNSRSQTFALTAASLLSRLTEFGRGVADFAFGWHRSAVPEADDEVGFPAAEKRLFAEFSGAGSLLRNCRRCGVRLPRTRSPKVPSRPRLLAGS